MTALTINPPTRVQETLQANPAVWKPQRILVPLDFSENAGKALDYARQLASLFQAKLFFVYIVEPMPALTDLRDMPLALSEKELVSSAREQLQQFVTEGLNAEVIVRKGKAYEQIVALAEEQGIDMIIMATHGYTGLQHTLLGSTTERVVRYAPCPVLVVRI